MPRIGSKWDKRYLNLAKLAASWSKDPSTKCGAVIVNSDNHIVSIGFNGFPQGVEDREKRLADRNIKYHMIVHAERNALIFANRSVRGCTVYTWPFQACAECTAMMIQAGIKRHVSVRSTNERWANSWDFAITMMQEVDMNFFLYENNDEPV